MTFNYKNQTGSFWRERLSDETFKVCHLRGTERPGTDGRKPHWRFKLVPGKITWNDHIRGPDL
jgi:hypothetical protein